jgi:bifunctional non-homologous end joining protein LigD
LAAGSRGKETAPTLIVGVQGPSGLTYAGHVGTGFSQQALRMLRRATAPFGSTVPPEYARGAVWAEPALVIEAGFALWTSSGRAARRDLPRASR